METLEQLKQQLKQVQTQLEDPLAEALLTGELSSGGEAEAVVDETGHVAVRAKGALTASGAMCRGSSALRSPATSSRFLP